MCEKNALKVQHDIATVWQDSHIFYGSILENIQMGKKNATMEEVVNAAKKVNMHDFIMTLPQQYNTHLGENGMRFSGGERQRIAIARAYLRDAKILIFDEATSSLDRKNELVIQDSFAKLRQGKTALVIAHRLATIKQADQICIIENGKIATIGTHSELMKSSITYQKLMGEQELGR